MQKFGIEIRKIGDTRGLYNEVDMVLKKHGIKPQNVSDQVKIQTVAHALNKILKVENYFSVCTIRDCADVCQVCISSERFAVYKAAHCISWCDMLPEYREMLVAMILDDFRPVLCQ